jgi:hypothetical protein
MREVQVRTAFLVPRYPKHLISVSTKPEAGQFRLAQWPLAVFDLAHDLL